MVMGYFGAIILKLFKYFILCSLEGQGEVFLLFLWIQWTEIKSIRKEPMDQSTEGHPVTPGRREVFYVDILQGKNTQRHPWGKMWRSTKDSIFFCSSLITDLVVAGFVLTPVENLLFDRSSSSCGCGWPLKLEVSGNGCPAKWNIFPLPCHLAKLFFYTTTGDLLRGSLLEFGNDILFSRWSNGACRSSWSRDRWGRTTLLFCLPLFFGPCKLWLVFRLD